MSKKTTTKLVGTTLATAAAAAAIATAFAPTASADCREYFGGTVRLQCSNGFAGSGVVSAGGGAAVSGVDKLAVLSTGGLGSRSGEVADPGDTAASGGNGTEVRTFLVPCVGDTKAEPAWAQPTMIDGNTAAGERALAEAPGC